MSEAFEKWFGDEQKVYGIIQEEAHILRDKLKLPEEQDGEIFDMSVEIYKKVKPYLAATPQWQDMRVREIGEAITDSDMVLLNKKFARLGFDTEWCHYYAGRLVIPMMMPIITSEPPKP